MLFDISLLYCAVSGHATYRPDESDLAARLHAATSSGDAWRCLRCGDLSLGEPTGSGPAQDAPVVPRGRQLRELVFLRILAVERIVKFFVLTFATFAVWRFAIAQVSFAWLVHDEVTLLTPAAERLGWNLEESAIYHLAQNAAGVSHRTLTVVCAVLACYGLVQLAEGIGLWLAKRWGEYLAAVATSAFIPLEVYELVHHASMTKSFTLVFNIAVVVWLIYSKRLFNFRGGAAAYRAQHHEASLLSIESAALVRAARQ